jgi:hypothetical protein
MKIKLFGLLFDNSDGVWSLGRRDGWEVFVERTEEWQRHLRGFYGDEDCDGASLWLGRWVVQFDFGRKAAAMAAMSGDERTAMLFERFAAFDEQAQKRAAAMEASDARDAAWVAEQDAQDGIRNAARSVRAAAPMADAVAA